MNQRVFVLIHKQLQLHTQLTAVMQQCFVGTGNARRPAVEVQMRLVVELTDLGVAYFVNQIAMAYRKNPPATAMRGLENSALITCPGKLIGRCQPRNPPAQYQHPPLSAGQWQQVRDTGLAGRWNKTERASDAQHRCGSTGSSDKIEKLTTRNGL